ncbi:MAG: orotidine-5'-phosphate decarboxylase, partial [Gammaproteobacteria bacterium]|nr:orotidine-5'-phosphate decarboxylase [Gammaproteobacteria bacterium]
MIITALDFPSLKEATAFVDRIDPSLTRLKVGKELFTASGPGFVEGLAKRGFDVFLDLKFHDIPNTVAGGVRSAASLGVWMLTVHASGGPSMLSAARDACPKFVGNAGTRIVAVTVLTSLDDAELKRVGVDADMQTQVKRLTDLTHECQLDGVVCSPLEAAATRQQTDADFLIVTPGVRPAMATSDDQRRVMTPVDAKA